MSVSQDFSRRFFADFIASRIKAWTLEEGATQPSIRDPSAVVDEAASRNEPSSIEPPPLEKTGGLIVGLGSSGP